MKARSHGAAALDGAPAMDRGRLGVRVWLRLLAGAALVTDRLRRSLRDEFGVTLPAFDLMAQTHREPRGPTMSELSRRLMVTKGNVSELVERLEKDRLVERHADAIDGRVQHVHLTAAGEALVERMLPAHRAWLSQLMADMDEARLAQLCDLLGTFKAAVSQAEERARGAGGQRAPRDERRERRARPAVTRARPRSKPRTAGR